METRALSQKTVFCLLTIVFLLISLLMQNRSFFFGYLVAGAGIVCFFFLRLKFAQILSLCLSVAIILFVLVCFVKVDSSDGRMLIYKLSFKILSDHFFSGVGQGRFGVELGLAQISYFSTGDYSVRELLLADNVVHAYNDYLEFLVEHGLAAVVVILAGFCFLFLLIRKIRFVKKQLSIFALLCLLQVFAMLVAACFTFVFYRFLFQVLFIFCLLYLTYYAGVSRRYLLGVSVVVLLGLVFCHWGKINNVRFAEELDQIRMYSKSGYGDEALEICEALEPYLGSDEEFLWLYVNCLLEVADGVKAVRYAKRLVQFRNNNLVYGLLARAYFIQGDNGAAELHYANAVNKVPNRFHSRYELFEFYLKSGDIKKAKTVKNQILLLPVKIPSVHVDRIKRSVQNVNL